MCVGGGGGGGRGYSIMVQYKVWFLDTSTAYPRTLYAI